MAQVKVKFATSASISKVWLDGIRLRFTNGISAKELADGRLHTLHWVIRGAPADTYSLAVTAPSSVSKELAKDEELGKDKIGYGLYDFRL